MPSHTLSSRSPSRLPTVPFVRRAALLCLEGIKAQLEAWQRAAQAARDRRELQALDNETLKNIGLDRSDIESWITRGDIDRRAR